MGWQDEYSKARADYEYKQSQDQRPGHHLPGNPDEMAGHDLEGWEVRRQNEVDTAMARYGLSNFMQGGSYAPERLLALFNQLYGSSTPGTTPSMQAGSMQAAQMRAAQMQAGQMQAARMATPNVQQAMQYGQGALGMAARGAGLQTQASMRGLEGLNPAARMAALQDISRAGAANLGGAGAQGYMQGLGLLGQQAQTNAELEQQAGGANLNALMQARGSNLNAEMAARQANLQAEMSARGQNLGAYQQTGLANLNALMQGQALTAQDRANALGLFQSGLSNTFGAGQIGAGMHFGSIGDYWAQQNENQQRQRDRIAGGIGSLAGAGIGALTMGGAGVGPVASAASPASTWAQGNMQYTNPYSGQGVFDWNRMPVTPQYGRGY